MFGYAKIHSQIFDSSIAEDWQVRHVFEDLLILSNSDGVVDMTHEAIARRTNVPIEIVTRAITELEKPDKKSRSDVESGARIKRLDEHRNWGWWIINHAFYRDMTTDDQYREKTRARVRRFRQNAKENQNVTPVTLHVTPVTPSRSSKQMANAKADTNELPLPLTPPSALGERICQWFRRRVSTSWSEKELKSLKAAHGLNPTEEEITLLEKYYLASIPENKDYRRRDIVTLLNNWNGELDRARRWSGQNHRPTADAAF